MAVVTAQRPALNCGVGIGLRAPHAAEVAATRPNLALIEVHAENYMAETAALKRLVALRRDYPVSIMASLCPWAAPRSSIAFIFAGSGR
jgi:hypothetical protein